MTFRNLTKTLFSGDAKNIQLQRVANSVNYTHPKMSQSPVIAPISSALTLTTIKETYAEEMLTMNF